MGNLFWVGWNRWVHIVTQLSFLTQRFLGLDNLMYLALLHTVSRYTQTALLLPGSSFIHYAKYIGTYYYRVRVNPGLFMRDAMFFKTVAFSQLFYHYYHHFELDLISLAMIGVGLALQASATSA